MEALSLATSITPVIFEKYLSLNIRTHPQVIVAITGDLKKELSKANKGNATHTVIMSAENSIIKNMNNGEQQEMKTAYLPEYFAMIMEGKKEEMIA